MSDLIVAGFDDTHTAFLARAALARMQDELSLGEHDLVVVTRKAGDKITLHEAIDLCRELEMHPTFWETLLCLLFARGLTPGLVGETPSASLTAIGIDSVFRARLAEQVRPATSALFVLVNGSTIRYKVLGVLRGLRGEIVQTELMGDDPKVWQRTLMDGGDEMSLVPHRCM